MFSKLSSFAILAVSVYAATATAHPMDVAAVSTASNPNGNTANPVPLAPDAITLINLCLDINFGRCSPITQTFIPTGCFTMAGITGSGGSFVGSVSSVKATPGIQCTLFSTTNCSATGGNSVFVGGDIPDLGIVGLDNRVASASCVAN